MHACAIIVFYLFPINEKVTILDVCDDVPSLTLAVFYLQFIEQSYLHLLLIDVSKLQICPSDIKIFHSLLLYICKCAAELSSIRSVFTSSSAARSGAYVCSHVDCDTKPNDRTDNADTMS